ncbi:LysR substrate-binding domain-containing protein [Jannaschia sp. S6380]|uniref:hydrogen peroxide-inducible genes activator n=1 Tax=Jannaschia sp. S6380 TaxID=2926408 RepID=UPI001FF648D1|nr:hydrogen peroxide-inducible genes activator [Jannaschia sp. S6380]MCK0167708.1 LysR substrate-binding domain-containing protein [Jannaschia sp. S6380]
MNNLTLRQLRYFEALARHRHFGRAAAASSISQPALSVQIRELEETLGAKLFERGPRQVAMTAFGAQFAPRVRDILRSVDELGDLARVSQGGFAGRLRMGIIPTVAPYLLPRLIRTLTAAYPGLDLDIRETVTSRLIEEMADGAIDTAVVALPISEPSLIETPLLTESFVLIRAATDRGAPMPAREDLQEMRLLLLEEGHCFRDQALSFCDIATAGPRPGLDGSTLSTLVQMVASGIGVTLIPEMAVGVETRSAPVAIDRFPAPGPRRVVGMVWRRTSPLGEQYRDMADRLRVALRSAP